MEEEVIDINDNKPKWHFPWRDGGRCKWLKNDKNKNWGEKKAECLDDTSPDEMEEDVSDKKLQEWK